jgi:AbrB family looped-hinge helix DNA binding protein
MDTTTLSSKGQVIIPKEIRDSLGWRPGMKLVVENLSVGILLRSPTSFPATDLHEGLGCAGYAGACKSAAQMKEGIDRMIRRQWHGSRKS